MEYLVLRLQGLMMSFGEGDHWDVRGTNRFPTKSFIVGLLSAGMGLPRSANDEIRNISQGISIACREDKQPSFLRDYHTILDTMKADGEKNKNAVISPRHYLADGEFIVLIGIKDQSIKDKIVQALIDPVWSPYLGRKSCIPAAPIFSGKIINAVNDYEAFKLVTYNSNLEDDYVFSCIGETDEGRMSFVKDEVISYEPRVFKDRKIFYYTLSVKEITV